MNPRATWLLLFLALALGGYLYVTERRPASPGEASDGGLAAYTPVNPATVTAVELLRSNAVVRVERGTNGWNLTVPVRYRAQGTVVEAFLDELAKLRPRAHLPSAQLAATGATNGLKAFGLEEGAITVKLEQGDGNPVLFKLGGPAPLGGQFYFQRIGADGVFTADESFLGNLPRTADFWRDRRLFDLRGQDYDLIEVRGKTGFVAEKNATNGLWRIVKPLSARADGARLEALLAALQNVPVAAFVSDSPLVDLEPLGLQPAEAELVVGRGTNDVAWLEFGRIPTNTPNYVLVRRPATTNIVLVPAKDAVAVRLPLASFRDRRLVPPVEDATRLQFRAGAEVVVAERQGTNWSVTAPRKFPADPDLMAQLLRLLGTLQIAEFPNDVPADLARYGLEKPTQEFVLGRGTNELVRLAFGAQDGLDKVFVKRADEPAVYSMPLAELLRLPETAAQLRDLRFGPTNVTHVEIRQQGRTRTLTRGVDGSWAAGTVPVGTVADAAITETLYRMGRLDSARFALRDQQQFEVRKFPEVAHELVLRFPPGGAFQTLKLQFGGPNPANNRFATAQFDDDPGVVLFEFPGPLYDDVRRDFSAP